MIAQEKLFVTIPHSFEQDALRPALAKQAEEHLANLGNTDARERQDTETDLSIPATGTKPNTSFIDRALLTTNGRVDTNASTLRVNKGGPRIYAVGEVASYVRPATHLIINAIPVLCTNIKRNLLLAARKEEVSVGTDRPFAQDARETQLVPIGKNKGVGAAMAWQEPSFVLWLINGRDSWLMTIGGLWSRKQ